MINMRKTYRTRDGREVRIYAVDGTHPRQVHGAVLDEGAWLVWTWRANGRSGVTSENKFDLIEVKPRIKRTMWINIYEHESQHETKEAADKWAAEGRTACVKVEIDCEQGEGL